MRKVPLTRAASTTAYTTSFTYDALDRPTAVAWNPAPSATAPSAASSVLFQHTYNAVNQRTGQSVSDNAWIDYPSAAASTAYTANNLNQYTAVGAVTPAYDANANLTDDGSHRYGYDAENRLVSVGPSGNATPCVTACYAFDGRGRRKTRTVNGTTTVSITDADNREVLEYDGGTGAVLRWYAYGLGPNDLLNQMDVAAGTRTLMVPDLLGSIVATMVSTSATLAPLGYRPYGASAAPPTGFAFTGQRFDPESGLYYYRARQYHPGWGRFPQTDPIGYGGGANLYAYVGNDPLSLVDRFGLDKTTSSPEQNPNQLMAPGSTDYSANACNEYCGSSSLVSTAYQILPPATGPPSNVRPMASATLSLLPDLGSNASGNTVTRVEYKTGTEDRRDEDLRFYNSIYGPRGALQMTPIGPWEKFKEVMRRIMELVDPYSGAKH